MPRSSPARSLALSALTEITEAGAYANIVLRQSFSRATLDARDKALVTEIVNESLRNLYLIDHLINQYSKTPTEKMKPFIRNLLRISVCQMLFMDKIPHSAAVNEAVKLAKKYGFANLSGFVNGVLRTISRNPFEKNEMGDFRLRYSYPVWLFDSLTQWLGEENARHFCENSHCPPTTTIFTNTIKITPEDLITRLQNENITCIPGVVLKQCITIKNSSDIASLPSFKEGLFFVMDEGAVWAVKALNVSPGQTMADLCAAPGGKSFAAACMMEDKGQIQSFDLHPHRVALINDSIKRMGFSSLKATEKDATQIDIDPVDAVLLDAPCSGLGIIRRRPDIKIHRKPTDINALADTQRALLSAAASCVKPGGTLVYCTCTVAREENIDNIKWFANHYPFTTQEPFSNIHDLPHHLIEDNCVQLLPDSNNDAFFIAKLVKNHA